MKGEVLEARATYHLPWSPDDAQLCVPLGAEACSAACTHCCTLCTCRVLPSQAGKPGIGILSETERKNGWQLAAHAQEARPDGEPRLLARAVWDTDEVRDAPLVPTR
jgi:hypothetical protein